MARVHVVWTDAATAWDAALLPGEGVRDVVVDEREGAEALARLSLERPTSGLLASGQPTHAFVSVEHADGSATLLFRGRVVGAPRGHDGAFAEIELDSRDGDMAAKVAAALAPLKTIPQWDPLYIAQGAEDDPAEVLDGWPRVLHIDRTDGSVTTVDIIDGDGAAPVVIPPEQVEGESVTYEATGAPAPRVEVTVTAEWTQKGTGTLDLGRLFRETVGPTLRTISPYHQFADTWLAPGESLGQDWEVVSARLVPQIPATGRWPIYWLTVGIGQADQTYRPEAVLRWTIEKRRRESVLVTVEGAAQDVGSVAPEVVRLSLNLPDVVAAGALAPDSGSFFMTDRGRQAVEHAAHVAATMLTASQRCVEVRFRIMGFTPEALALTCGRTATVQSDRLPGGTATGKVVALSYRRRSGEEAVDVTLAVSVGVPHPMAPSDGERYVEPDYWGDGYGAALGSAYDLGAARPLVLNDWSDQGPTDAFADLSQVAPADLATVAAGMQAPEQKALAGATFPPIDRRATVYQNPTWWTLDLSPLSGDTPEHGITVTAVAPFGVPGGIDLGAT